MDSLLTIRTDTRKFGNSDNDYNALTLDQILRLIYAEEPVLGLHFVNDADGTDYPLNPTDTLEVNVDIDLIHNLQTGTLVDPITGITIAIVANFPAAPNPTGYLIPKNEDGDRERIEYTAVTGTGPYTFTVDKTLDYSYVAADEISVEDPLMTFADDDDFNIPGDWDDINDSEGKRSVRLNCFRDSFINKIPENEDAILVWFEVKRWIVGKDRPIELCKDLVFAERTVRDIEAAGNVSNESLSRLDARYEKQVSGIQETLIDDDMTPVILAETGIAGAVEVLATVSDGTTKYLYNFLIVHDGAIAGIGQRSARIGPAISGISFSADIDSGNLRLKATLSAVGQNLTMVYRITQVALEV